MLATGLLTLVLATAGCSASPAERAADVLRQCFVDAGEEPESVTVLFMTDDGQVAVISAPGVGDGVVTRCIDDYNRGALLPAVSDK